MKLFLGTACPQCDALKKRIDLESVEGLEVYVLPSSGVPITDDDAAAFAEADFHNVFSVPALVTSAGVVLDVFEILEILKSKESDK